VQVATLQALARYWATHYDWRKAEAKLNALPQFTTEIDGVEIHFIHVRSRHSAIPATSREAGTSARPSPTRWAARRPRGCWAST
jgi:hypothetical protein